MSTSDPPHDDDPDGDDRLDALLRAAMGGPPGPTDDAAEAEPDDDDIDDGLIRAWRAGALSDDAGAALEGQLAASPEARALAAASIEPVPEPLLTWAEQQAPRAAAPRRGWRPLLALAAVALLAVGGGLLLLRSGVEHAYVTSPLTGGAATVRSEAAVGGVPVFRPGGVLEVTLRPPQAGEAPPVAAFVAPEGGPLRAVAAAVERVEGGAVIVRAPAGRLFGSEYGPWRFYVALGDPGRAAGRIFDEAREAGDAQWFEYPLAFEPTPDAGGDP